LDSCPDGQPSQAVGALKKGGIKENEIIPAKIVRHAAERRETRSKQTGRTEKRVSKPEGGSPGGNGNGRVKLDNRQNAPEKDGGWLAIQRPNHARPRKVAKQQRKKDREGIPSRKHEHLIQVNRGAARRVF